MDNQVTMYFNPSCSKCLYALEFLQQKGITPNLINYLEQTPSFDELKKLAGVLGVKPLDIVRTGEPVFLEKFAGKNLTDDEWLKVIVDHPVLLQRPLLIKENNGVIGRSPEQLDRLMP